MKFFARWLITALAVAVAVWLVPGIHTQGTQAWLAVAVVAVVLAFINAFIKPVIKALTGCLYILTLGVFALIVNAGLLYFSAWFCNSVLEIGFYVDGFWPAFWGGVIISIVTVILNALTGAKE